MHIRQETQSDYLQVHRLVERSFATTTHSDGTEADYLDKLRHQTPFIPELSLVAEDDSGQIIGQITLCETQIRAEDDQQYTELVLSPICVDPAYFRQGIARAMIETACDLAREKGYTAVFLCGDPQVYQKVGFAPSYTFGIYHRNDKTKKAVWSMARELTEGALRHKQGTIHIL
jgi:predicted N-acetyltransferase YhbS